MNSILEGIKKYDPENKLDNLSSDDLEKFIEDLTNASIWDFSCYIDANNAFGRKFIWLDCDNTINTFFDDWLTQREFEKIVEERIHMLENTIDLCRNEIMDLEKQSI